MVNSSTIVNNSVTTVDLADNSVTSPKIKDGEVKTVDIANDAITSSKIKRYAVRPRHLDPQNNYFVYKMDTAAPILLRQ